VPHPPGLVTWRSESVVGRPNKKGVTAYRGLRERLSQQELSSIHGAAAQLEKVREKLVVHL
jgi:hypothetical protein